jgi:hypothetical protein
MSKDIPVSGPVQVKVYSTLERLGAATSKEIARACGLTEMQVVSAVDKFLEANRAYICDWKFEAVNSSSRVIKLGRGVSVPRWKSAKGEHKIPKGDMHLLDYRQQHLAHQEFMKNFKPHPDVAAAWLLNPIQGKSA